jgi:hypothetical protein
VKAGTLLRSRRLSDLIEERSMSFRRTFRTSAGAAALGLGLLASAAPAEAQFRASRGALAAGLFGGIALGFMAASANQARVAAAYAPVYGEVPEEFEPGESWAEPPRRLPPPQVRRAPAPALNPARPPRSASALRACRDAIAKASLPYGSTRVSVADAGPAAARPEDRTVNVRARIEYADGGRREVRSAQVSCRLNGGGEVVALR